MDFLHNPFHILSATPQDNRQKIVQLADKRILFFKDPDMVRKAVETLTKPLPRLSAEIAWLPVKKSGQAEKICELLEPSMGNSSLRDRLRQVQDFLAGGKLMPIAKCNVLAAGIQRLPRHSLDDVASWIFKLAWVVEDINAEQVRAEINAKRKISGFAMVDLQAIEPELQNLRDYYRRVMTSALNNLSATERAEAINRVVEHAIRSTRQMPLLIYRLVDQYEVSTQESVKERETEIVELDGRLRSAADEGAEFATVVLVYQLIQAVKNWVAIVQPIQVCKKCRGLPHNESKRVARRMRKLVNYLFYEHDKLDFCQQLIRISQEAFAEDADISDDLVADARELAEIARQRERDARRIIERQVEKLRAAADEKKHDSILNPMVNKLIQSVREWKALAQLLEEYSTGYPTEVCLVVKLAVHLRIAHDKLDFSRLLFRRLQEVFTEVRDCASSIAARSNALEDAERALGGITKHVNKMRVAAVTEIPDMVNQLIRSVKEWKDRAQLIKPYYANYSMGARFVTDLALDLQNKPCRFDDSLKLFEMLHEELAEVDEIAADVAEALEALEAAESARRHIENQVVELLEVVYRKHRKHYHPDLKPSVDQLIRTVRGWRDLALPIKASCGDYCSVAKLVLDLAKKLWKKGKHRSSGQLRDMVQDIFGEIPEIETLLDEEAKGREETERKYTHLKRSKARTLETVITALIVTGSVAALLLTGLF